MHAWRATYVIIKGKLAGREIDSRYEDEEGILREKVEAAVYKEGSSVVDRRC